MIKVKNLYKSFDKQPVLTDINIEIGKNQIVALQGPSGAGKTTLLKSIGLLDSIDSGSILFNNEDITLLNSQQKCVFRNQKIGFVFQFHNLLPEFSALENICMPALIAKNSISKSGEKAEKLMDSLNILNKKNSKPNELSGGEQQRVAIARALINSPQLILADEPSGNLDSKQSIDMLNIFNEMSSKYETTFLIITHNNNLAKMCDTIIKIEDGKIIK